MFTSPARFLLTLAAIFALLTTMWVSAAHADTYDAHVVAYKDAQGRQVDFEVAVVTSQSTDARQRAMVCERRALVQGTVGEGVIVCDVPSQPVVVKAMAHRSVKGARVGHTVVVARMGARS